MKSPKLPNYLWLVVAVPFIYLAYRYPGLPAEIPIHYNFQGEADGRASKMILWIVPVLLSLLTLLTLLTLIVLHVFSSMDTSDGLQKMGRKYTKMNSWTVVFTTALACYIISQVGREQITYFNFGLVLMGGLFLITGNYLPTVRPNEIVGIRTPWALANDKNWRLTHRFGGRVWFVTGILIIICGFLIHPDFDSPVLIIAIILLIGIPYLYSYRISRR